MDPGCKSVDLLLMVDILFATVGLWCVQFFNMKCIITHFINDTKFYNKKKFRMLEYWKDKRSSDLLCFYGTKKVDIEHGKLTIISHSRVVYVFDLVGNIPYRTKFWRTKFSAPSRNFGSFVWRNFFISFLFRHTIQKKNMFWHEFCINFTCFRFQRTKYIGGQNFSADKIFGSKS